MGAPGERVYVGTRDEHGNPLVTVEGVGLDPRLDLRCHSPSGLNWGYGGSGPAQCALAILADALGEQFALPYYQDFKRQVVGGLPQEGFQLLAEDIQDWFLATVRHELTGEGQEDREDARKEMLKGQVKKPEFTETGPVIAEEEVEEGE